MRTHSPSDQGPTPLRARLAVCALAIVAIAWTIVLLHARGDYSDLAVYRWGGHHAFDASNLYSLTHPTTGLQFTYTPFALVLFWLLDAVHTLAPVPFVTLSLVALARTCWVLAPHARRLFPQISRRWMTMALVAATLMMEPAGGTLILGQINLVLLWLVVEGLLGPLGERRSGVWGGVLVAIACAIKLTPGIFLVLLVLVWRWRAALAGGAAMLTTMALGWAALPHESHAFWSGTGTDSSRVGAMEYAPNQSLDGVIWRWAGPGGNHALWLVLAVLLGGFALLLARRAWLDGDRVSATGLAALCALLVSPVSWSHHWVTLLPLIVGLLCATQRVILVRTLTLAACVIFGSRMVWRIPQLDGREFHLSFVQRLESSSYVIASILLLIAATCASTYTTRSRHPHHRHGHFRSRSRSRSRALSR